MPSINALPEDVLTRLLFFLPNEETGTLWMTGDKKLHATMGQVTEVSFSLVPVRPISWPSRLLRALPGLRSFIFGYTPRLSNYGMKNVDLSVLPKGLTNLQLSFGNLLASMEDSMSSYAPELESLTLTGMNPKIFGKLLPLPHYLTSLKLIHEGRQENHVSMTLFRKLPRTLRSLEVVGEVYFTGTESVAWPESLETLHVATSAPQMLAHLPAALRSLHLHFAFSSVPDADSSDSESSESHPDIEPVADEADKMDPERKSFLASKETFWSLLPAGLTDLHLTCYASGDWLTAPKPDELPKDIQTLHVMIYDSNLLMNALVNPNPLVALELAGDRNAGLAAFFESRPSLKDVRMLGVLADAVGSSGLLPRPAPSAALAKCRNKLTVARFIDVTPPEDLKYLQQPLFKSLTTIKFDLTENAELPDVLLPDKLELPPQLERFSLKGPDDNQWRFNIAVPQTLKLLHIPGLRFGKKYLKGKLHLPDTLSDLSIALNALSSRRAIRRIREGLTKKQYLSWHEILPKQLKTLKLGQLHAESAPSEEYEALAPWNVDPNGCAKLPRHLTSLSFYCPAENSFWKWLAKLPPTMPLLDFHVAHGVNGSLSPHAKDNPWIEWPQWPQTLHTLHCELFGFNPNLFKLVPRRLQHLHLVFHDNSAKMIFPEHLQLLPATIVVGKIPIVTKGPLRQTYTKTTTRGMLVAPAWVLEAADNIEI